VQVDRVAQGNANAFAKGVQGKFGRFWIFDFGFWIEEDAGGGGTIGTLDHRDIAGWRRPSLVCDSALAPVDAQRVARACSPSPRLVHWTATKCFGSAGYRDQRLRSFSKNLIIALSLSAAVALRAAFCP
jgi:hypothetical protein